jgi:hypothetical protein
MGSPVPLLDLIRSSKVDMLNRSQDLAGALGELGLLWAVIFVILGSVCVFNGYRWHKTIVLVLAVLGGAAVGVIASQQIDVAAPMAALMTSVLFAVLAYPLMKFTIALFAGAAGAFCGANAWTAIGQPADQHHIGSIIGLVALAMLAFIAYRLVVIAFTAIGGAALLTLGTLAALLHVDAWRQPLVDAMSDNTRMAPLITGVVAIVGIVIQQGGGVKGLMECADKADPAKAKAKAQGKPATG